MLLVACGHDPNERQSQAKTCWLCCAGFPIACKVDQCFLHEFYVLETYKFVDSVKAAVTANRPETHDWNTDLREVVAVISTKFSC